MMTIALLLCALLNISIGDVYDNCYECEETPEHPFGLCCDEPPQIDDTAVCKHWTSNRAETLGAAGGAPLDVCFGAFSGIELTSTSHMYKCSDDKKTVEFWAYTGSSDCNENTATTFVKLPFSFDPVNNPDTDSFECEGSPCSYYIIEDGTAHPTQTCPYDVGKDYLTGGHDYATWHLKLLLQGCQTFDGQTSLLLKCSTTGGITLLKFSNPTCNFDGLIGGEEMFTSGTVECNYGTGRSVYCFDEEHDQSTTTTTAPGTGSSTTGSGTGSSSTALSSTALSSTALSSTASSSTASSSTGSGTASSTGSSSTGSGTGSSSSTDGTASSSTASGTGSDTTLPKFIVYGSNAYQYNNRILYMFVFFIIFFRC